ncbi:MAG: hypothetical protein IJJ10_02020 [Bacillus sp. (in: Bacteria)]|nr:hypothetical protein [Bacillus sp. (in: firmicutes)]
MIKIIGKFLLVFSIFLVLFGCQNEKAVNKEKYNSAIEQVISLENSKFESKKIELKRKDIGIAVYSQGKYIELMYEIDNKKIESMYEYDSSKKIYIEYPHTPKHIKKIESELKEINYIENLGYK